MKNHEDITLSKYNSQKKEVCNDKLTFYRIIDASLVSLVTAGVLWAGLKKDKPNFLKTSLLLTTINSLAYTGFELDGYFTNREMKRRKNNLFNSTNEKQI